MSSTFGTKLKISVFGESHGQAIGVCIDGFPAGVKIDFDRLQKFLNRRAPGNHEFSTSRKEADKVEFLSGVLDGCTTGFPITCVIYNRNKRSEDYSNLQSVPRPSHADFTAEIKYKGSADMRGGGHFSGRLTAPICAAGGICLQYLEQKGIYIGSHIFSIGQVSDIPFDLANVGVGDFNTDAFPVNDENARTLMLEKISQARKEGDSLGGVIECAVIGLNAGIGNPMFDGIENKISQIVFGIPAVKGIEFGNGFDSTRLFGSQNNDEFYFDAEGNVKTATNNHGGVLGGITSGMPIVFRAAIKPTPSISVEQQSVDLSSGKNTKLIIHGRHDPCIVPRAVACVEAAAAVAICDFII
ncbi:MAG: chorismate synthase [bacterium]|nr:chorismate synthase [bacterium]